jgi:hypothetical protein
MSAGVNTLMASLLSALRASAFSMPCSNSTQSNGQLWVVAVPCVNH